jgi:hypothetical protein
MFGPPEMVTIAEPDWLVSSELVAVTVIRFGDGADAGATNSPDELIVPQAAETPHPAPETIQVTC